MIRVKICGLSRLEDALVGLEAGADMLGFVFASSRRQVKAEVVREIVHEIHRRSGVKAVGVFVNADPEEMNRVAKVASLDYVQLHGDEPPDLPRRLDVPSIQTIRISCRTTSKAVAERAHASQAEIVLFDTESSEAYGGTGRTFDWSLLPKLERPTLLAGGLNARNVLDAVKRTQPWGVDVSSGVEIDGKKDPEMIRSFIGRIREAKL